MQLPVAANWHEPAAIVWTIPWFPFGSGLLDRSAPFPVGGVMVIGQDWGCQKDFAKPPQRDPTTPGLIAKLGIAGISPSQCYLSNALVGLRQDDEPGVGWAKAWHETTFVEQCRRVFVHQLNVQRPRAVILLGVPAIRFGTIASLQLRTLWGNVRTLTSVDKTGHPLVAGAAFEDASPALRPLVAAISHPSFRSSNQHREYKGRRGSKAEAELLTDLGASLRAVA